MIHLGFIQFTSIVLHPGRHCARRLNCESRRFTTHKKKTIPHYSLTTPS
jgi:hypothetical protein